MKLTKNRINTEKYSNNGDSKKYKMRYGTQSWETGMRILESEITVAVTQTPEP